MDNLNAVGNLNSTHEELMHMLGLKAGRKEVYSSSCQVNPKRPTSRHTIIKMKRLKRKFKNQKDKNKVMLMYGKTNTIL